MATDTTFVSIDVLAAVHFLEKNRLEISLD
jgi:hypothetical protein